ncbi:MAG: cytochrome c-type biogenesis protein CcmH [Kangiellaceae bacterium]|nr:cytochrome c-type biogenesis protein CcmH [Kangiellaceae bacterium]
MKKYLLALTLLFTLLLTSLPLLAVIETYEFDNTAQEQMYYQVINQLRCPKCQNQTIADSDAPLSKDLRYIVYQKVMAGESEAQIFSYMQQRYGDFVLYEPPVKPANYFIWFAPIFVFLIIIIALVVKVGRRKVINDEQNES